MTKKQKAIWIAGVFFLALMIAGIGFALTSGACGFGPDHGPGFFRKGPPFMHEEIGNFILWRLDNGAKQLSLSDHQQRQYDRFRENVRDAFETGIKARTVFRQKMIEASEAETPDLNSLALEARDHVEALSRTISENLTAFSEFFASLDTHQKETVADGLKKRLQEKHRECWLGERRK